LCGGVCVLRCQNYRSPRATTRRASRQRACTQHPHPPTRPPLQCVWRGAAATAHASAGASACVWLRSWLLRLEELELCAGLRLQLLDHRGGVLLLHLLEDGARGALDQLLGLQVRRATGAKGRSGREMGTALVQAVPAS